jgi:hypothetical protein
MFIAFSVQLFEEFSGHGLQIRAIGYDFLVQLLFFYLLLARASSSCLFQFIFIVCIAFVCWHELEARASLG